MCVAKANNVAMQNTARNQHEAWSSYVGTSEGGLSGLFLSSACVSSLQLHQNISDKSN